LPVRVNDPDQLTYRLTEAAEIEHGLMCSDLYARVERIGFYSGSGRVILAAVT
jgi:hypothetical protein